MDYNASASSRTVEADVFLETKHSFSPGNFSMCTISIIAKKSSLILRGGKKRLFPVRFWNWFRNDFLGC